MADSAPTVTVAIVVKDRLAAMSDCLDGIAAQTRAPDQIVVVDNGSTDGTWELLEARAADHPGMVIAQDTGSLGAIRNLAVRLATGDVIAFTDSDCVPTPSWLAHLCPPLADPTIGIVQGRTMPAAESSRRWAATQQITQFSSLYEACNIAYRRAALRETTGFDESIGFFGEDTAAGWLARRAGWRCGFAADAVVHHDVTYPGIGWHLRRAMGYSNWPAQVAKFPEMREELLWSRWWLNRHTAAFDLAVVATAIAAVRRRPGWLSLTLPYLKDVVSPLGGHRSGMTGAVDAACGVGFDCARLAGLVTGCVRHRTIVL